MGRKYFNNIIFVTDKAPSEASFRGSEFLAYDLSQTGGEPIVSAQDTVSFYFKTRQPNGLLFYTGDGSDYLNLAMKDGGVSLTMGLANGKQEMQIKPNRVRFDDNQWHKVTVHRRIQEVNFTFNNLLYSEILYRSFFPRVVGTTHSV